jgi:hypothetical protein
MVEILVCDTATVLLISSEALWSRWSQYMEVMKGWKQTDISAVWAVIGFVTLYAFVELQSSTRHE